MKVFVSWSGERSKALAQALHEWLPLVLQHVEPWVSDKDISAGDRWAQAIAGELESSNFGIICVTPENLSSEWILFEAGALSKSMQDAKVIPLLFGLELSDVSGPLAQFQAKKVDQAGLLEVVKAINKVSDDKATDNILEKRVKALWSDLEDHLSKIPDTAPSNKHMRPQTEVLEELVASVRGIGGKMRFLDEEMMDKERYFRRKKYRRLSPMMLDELMHFSVDSPDDPISLLMIAGLLREDFPWLAEVIIETYRDMRAGTVADADKAMRRLQRTMKMMRHGPMMDEMMGNSKEAHIVMMELPRMIEHVMHRNAQNTDDDEDSEKG